MLEVIGSETCISQKVGVIILVTNNITIFCVDNYSQFCGKNLHLTSLCISQEYFLKILTDIHTLYLKFVIEFSTIVYTFIEQFSHLIFQYLNVICL